MINITGDKNYVHKLNNSYLKIGDVRWDGVYVSKHQPYPKTFATGGYVQITITCEHQDYPERWVYSCARLGLKVMLIPEGIDTPTEVATYALARCLTVARGLYLEIKKLTDELSNDLS